MSKKSTRPKRALRFGLSTLTAALMATGSVLVATPAFAAPVYEITSRWADGSPTVVESGDVINSEWRVNLNDDAEAPSNAPVDNVTFTVTATHGQIVEIPDACLTTGVTPASSISADGLTLTCNVGTVHMGTAAAVQVPVNADGVTGDQVTLNGAVGGVTPPALSPIDIKNTFSMDMQFGGNTGTYWWDAGYTGVTVDLEWALRMGGGEAGPDSITQRVTLKSSTGSPITVGTAPAVHPWAGTAGCTAFNYYVAEGVPWSELPGYPADRQTNFVDSCTLTPVAGQPGVFDLTLTGINYDAANAPTKDSYSNPLPTDWKYIASGSLFFHVNTNQAGSVTLTSNTPTYTSPLGQKSTDLAANNTTNKPYYLPGGWSASWTRGITGSGGNPWDNDYKLTPGMMPLQVVDWYGGAVQIPAASQQGQCLVFDTAYVTYAGKGANSPYNQVRGVHNDGTETQLPDSMIEYYTGSTGNPANFNCGTNPAGWSTTKPADLTTVTAIRIRYPHSIYASQNLQLIQLNASVKIKDTAPVGQDVWMFGSVLQEGVWYGQGDEQGVYTPVPGGRYPTTTYRRDVLHIISVTPSVQKSTDRSSLKPGEAANFTLTYAANGLGSVAPSVDNYVLTDTMPKGMSYVPGSVSPEPVITQNAQGQQVLTWTLNGVTTNVKHLLTYKAVPNANAVPGQLMTNVASATVAGSKSPDAAATVTVSTNGYTQIGKSADTPFIPNTAGNGDGNGSWTVTTRSFDPIPQAWTDTIDILPYNGDKRGTSYSGSYTLAGIDAVAGATVYYTTADPSTLSDDPKATSNGGTPGSVTGNQVGWSTTYTADATAVRVIGPSLAPGATQAFKVRVTTDGFKGGDVLVNRAQGRDSHTELVMRTSAEMTMGQAYSAALKKYVQAKDGSWHDANDVTDYPVFHIGDTIRYRIVATNTGSGTLTNFTVTDDKQPELGSFTIDSLAPGDSQNHEYEVTASAAMGDSVVNNACATADLPADAEVPPTINCDPAGITIVGDPTHTKTLLSATAIGGGQWRIVYGIDVTNTSAASASYTLDDELHFTPQAKITSATVTKSPDGIVLSTPAWDGADHQRIVLNAPIAGNDDAGYAPQHYEVTVIADVPLQLTGAGSQPDPTVCPGSGDADQAFNNTSELTKTDGTTENGQACAPIPSISLTKTVAEGPTPNGDGTWTVLYNVVATNKGAAAGTYDATDMMTPTGSLEVVSGTVVKTPDGVTASPTWTGLGAKDSPENVIATGVNLAAGGVHTYQVKVVLGLIPGTEGQPTITPCSADSNSTGGLKNTAEVKHNDLTQDASACITVGVVVVDKSVDSGPTPNGDGTWTVVYDITATNVGGAAADYKVADRLEFGEGIDIVSAKVTSTPTGVQASADWTGRGAADKDPENLIASGVSLDAKGVHHYKVTAVVKLDEATIDPAVLKCTPGGNGGLGNSTTLDSNGIVSADEVCPTLPLITVKKDISSGPTPNGDGTWTITYDLTATNVGAADGTYKIGDELQFGTGIQIASAAVVTVPAGVTATADWDGLGHTVIATDVPLAAGGVHTYQVRAVVSLDLDTVTPDSLTCPAPGEKGGLSNSVTLTENGEDRTDQACATPPLIQVAKSLSGPIKPVAGQPGTYDATYEITVSNSAPGAGAYDLDDLMTTGKGITVDSVQSVTTDAPDSVGINPAFGTNGDTRVVTGQPIAAAAAGSMTAHHYTVVLRYTVDPSQLNIPAGATCQDYGLNNTANVSWNGYHGNDDACILPGKPVIDKKLVSADPIGDGTWKVVYHLTVSNTGTEPTTYSVDDELLFDPEVKAKKVTATGPDGVSIDDAFDGAAHQRIATDVGIAGTDDDGYAPHVYTVTVIADVPLHLSQGDADGNGAPGCTVAPGNNHLKQGFNNATTLTDETGGTQTDTDCAGVPSFTITKAMDGAPVQDGQGQWTVNYTVTVTNDGAVAGSYTPTDRLRYGKGIEVLSASIVAAPDGVTPAASWTGRGASQTAAENELAQDVNLAAGGVHVYKIRTVSKLDTATADASAITCPAAGSDQAGGFSNRAGIDHNDLEATADACATPEWPKNVPSPLATTGGAVAWGIVGTALLLLVAGGVLLIVRRRRGTDTVPAEGPTEES